MRENRRHYPLMAAAATSVIIFCMIGVGAFMGWLPVPRSTSGSPVGNLTGRLDAAPHNAAADCSNCGAIESIEVISVQNKPSGVGAIVGGVAGAILGHQVGGGSGKDLATIGGAAGGAYLGNEMEKGTKQRTVFRVEVRMNDGSHRIIHTSKQNFAVGQKVKIDGDEIIPLPGN